jgi:hypothetical protein
MNAYALKPGQIGIREAPSVQRATGRRIILVLTVLGLLASLVASLTYLGALEEQIGADQVMTGTGAVIKPPLYYAAHGAEILMLIAAGFLAMYRTRPRAVMPGYFARFGLFIVASLLMVARGYSPSTLLSSKIFDMTGPFPCLIALLLFVGVRRENWAVLGKVMVTLAVLFSAITVVRMAGLQTVTRQEGVLRLLVICNNLYFPAAWVFLNRYPRHSLAHRMRSVPIVVYTFGSLFTQTRLNFVMVFALLGVSAYLNHKRRMPQGAGWIAGLVLAAGAGMFAATFLADTPAVRKVEGALSGFSERLDEDTRTGQLRAFSENVPAYELLLGRGSLASWNWPGMGGEYRGGTDVGYLTLLFWGGLPFFITYTISHLTPCLRVLRNNAPDWQLTAAGVVVLWGVRMFSSAYPSYGLEYYPILLCVGACISREDRLVQRRIY